MSDVAELPASCFQGVMPGLIATCARDGTPNVTYLSQVHRLGPAKVAVSCQFFNKTKQNVLENPYACVFVHDPITFEPYRLELRFDHSESEGPLFETMALRIQGIASHTGMSGVFRLISADCYDVLACEHVEAFLVPSDAVSYEPEAMTGAHSELRALQVLSQRICRTPSKEELLDCVLETLDETFGFSHAMVLLPDECGERLLVESARGYGDSGVGAEVCLGEGLIGTVARERRLLRVSDLGEELRYGRAIRAGIERSSARRELRAEVPLPGLPDAQSMMIMPLVAGDRLVGVLSVESPRRLSFDEWDEAFLEIVANHVAIAIDAAQLRLQPRADAASAPSEASTTTSTTTSPPATARPHAGRLRRFRFFRSDDCVFADDDYLIRNVPGRILWKILRAYHDEGRTEFSNRELRLDASLGLPSVRDNLESRLSLLRKRLEQKCPELRLVPTSRGHFRLEAECALQLDEVDGTG